MHYSPLRYPGGKNKIFNFVANLIEHNDLLGCQYIEPYAGGAGLALRLLYEEYVERIIINDLDPLVYAFWSICQNENDKLCAWIDKVPVTIETWIRCKEIVSLPDKYSLFEIASSFLFLNRTNVSGVISAGVIGGIKQRGKYKINARFNKSEIINRIEKIGRYKGRMDIVNSDGVNLLCKLMDAKHSNCFIYIDPPYFEKGARLYLNAYTENDHISLAKQIHKLSLPWLLSYDYNSFIVNNYLNFEKMSYRLQHSTSNKTGDEILIFSDQIDYLQSLKWLNGVNKI